MKKLIVWILFSILISGVSFNSSSAAINSKKVIPRSDAPFFVSIWSIQKPQNSRDKYLCDAVVVDRNYAVGSASCLKQFDWPLVGVMGTSTRGDRGTVFPIYTWMWTSEFESSSVNHDLALIYAPQGIAPWALEYNQKFPIIDYPKKSNLELISWGTSSGQIKLQSIPMKILGKLPSKTSTNPSDNLFKATSLQASTKKNPLNCQTSSGSPLISRNNGEITLVGIVSGRETKCDPTKPVDFVLVQKFQSFINQNKAELANGLLRDRKGMELSPLYKSILSPKSLDYIPAKIGDNGSTSAVWTSNDPELIESDIWSIGLNIWKSGWNDVTIGFRDELDNCTFAKNSTVGVQISKNSKQNVDYAFEVKERGECWIPGKSYKYVDYKNSKTEPTTNCSVTLYPYGKNFSLDPNAKINYLSFYFNPDCLGVRENIWLRAYVNNGPESINTDVEPFYDGWYGPWKSTLF